MAYGGLDLGNLSAALSMTGGDPALAEELRRRQLMEEAGIPIEQAAPQQAAPAAPQRAPQLPPETNRALEATGSDYRLPENPYPEQVSQKDFNPRAPAKQRAAEYTEGQNEMLDLQTERGAIAADGAQQIADGYGQKSAALGQETASARQQVEQNRAQKDSYEAQAMARLDAMSAKMANPPKDTFQTVMNIVAAVAAMKGQQNAAVGMQMLGKAMGGKTERWQQAIAADQAMAGELMKAAKFQNEDSESELGQAKALSALVAGEHDAALKQVEASAQAPEAQRAAQELRLGLRQKYLEHQSAIDAQAAKAGAGARNKAIEDQYWRMPLQELAAAVDAGQAGKDAQNVFNQRVKQDQEGRSREVEMEQKLAATEKLKREQTEGPKPTEAQEKRDILVRQSADAFHRLSADSQGEGLNRGATKETWVPDVLRSEKTLTQRADIKALGMAVLRHESGANVPESEIKSKFEAHPVNSGDPEVRAEGLRGLLKAYRAMDSRGRLSQKVTSFQPANQGQQAVNRGR